jgi:hypothetical protein
MGIPFSFLLQPDPENAKHNYNYNFNNSICNIYMLMHSQGTSNAHPSADWGFFNWQTNNTNE